MTSSLVFLAVLLTVGLVTAKGRFEEYEKVVSECRIYHDITEQDMKIAKEGKTDFDQSKAKCAVTCVLRGLGLVNEDGEMNEELISTTIEKFVKVTNKEELPCKSHCYSVMNEAAKKCAQQLKQKNLKGCEVGAFFAKCSKEALGFIPM